MCGISDNPLGERRSASTRSKAYGIAGLCAPPARSARAVHAHAARCFGHAHALRAHASVLRERAPVVDALGAHVLGEHTRVGDEPGDGDADVRVNLDVPGLGLGLGLGSGLRF